MATVVEFRRVSYRIGERDILRNIDLSMQEGETLVLLGRSESGKTTLLRLVNRLVQASAGTILFDGRSVTEGSAVELRRRIGYVIQEAGLFPHWTVSRNIELVPDLLGWSQSQKRERAEEMLNLVGLAPGVYSHRFPRQLSGGERQRVGIARALAAQPKLLLLDEPFSALDPVTRYELQREFLRLRESIGLNAIFVTHDIREALMLGSRIVLLNQGSIEAIEPPREFLNARTPEAMAFLATLSTEC